MKKFTFEEVRTICRDLGYELLSNEYINSHTNLSLIDKDGYKYYVSLLSTYNGNRVPSKFHTSNIYTFENIKLWLRLNYDNLELLDNKYVNIKTKLTLIDAEGYKMTQTLNDLLCGRYPRKFDKSNIEPCRLIMTE